jgi:hypothetical protein
MGSGTAVGFRQQTKFTRHETWRHLGQRCALIKHKGADELTESARSERGKDPPNAACAGQGPP